jgi:RimJ/RimL family protein N-acetyltransferase
VAELVPGLATPRLLLRPVEQVDLAPIAQLANDKRIAETTFSLPHPLAPEQVAEWFDGLVCRNERAFAITLKETGNLIGVVSLTVPPGNSRGEIGYWLAYAHWGQGLMTEAVRRVARFAFGDLKMSRLKAGVFPSNVASTRVLLKSGFEEAGKAVRPAPARGGDRDVLLYEATRASFAVMALSQAVGRT